MEQALRLHVRRDERDLLRRASRELEVAQRLLVHGKDPHGGAVFGSHVADRGAVGERQRRDAGAVELHKFPDDTFLAEHFGHRSEEHTSELQSLTNLVCRLLLEKKKTNRRHKPTQASAKY